jgi:integrase
MARPKFQQGSIEHYGVNWMLRYYDPSGKRARAFLGSYASHPLEPNKRNVAELRAIFHDKITAILQAVNSGSTEAIPGGATVGDFIKHSYFTRLDWRLKAEGELHIEPSTVEAYKDIWKNYVESRAVSKIKLRDFTPIDARHFVEGIPQHLTHQTHLRVMNFLRGVFTWAIQDGAYRQANPFDGIKTGGTRRKRTDLDPRQQKIQESNQHAYTLEEVAEMLDKLPDPAKTVCAVAAFTGLSRSELRGLQWKDYDGETIQVRRKNVNGHIGRTKTEAREADVPVVPTLRKILTTYKKEFPEVGDGWIFRGGKLFNPLDLDNLSRRDIPQHINGAWFGWHAFRRGISTRLSELGVDAKIIQVILRHANISTTQAHYILPTRTSTETALKKLDKVYRSK